MTENPVRWPFTAIITHDGELLAEWYCSTPDSFLAAIRPYLAMPGVTITITVNEGDGND